MRGGAAGLVVIAAVAASAPAFAGGIFVPGAGPHAQARAGAFVAKSDDPSALNHNPAGFAKLDGTHISIGANFIDYDLTYQRTGSYEPSGEAVPPSYEGSPYPTVREESKPSIGIAGFQAIPLIAVSTDFGQTHWPVRFGFGMFSPQGFPQRTFAESYDLGGADPAPGPQRYDTIEQELRAISPSVAVAYSPLPYLDVGVRGSWGFSAARGKKAVWAIRNYEEFEGNDSVFTLEQSGDPFIPSFAAGVLYRPAPFVEVGAVYNSELRIFNKGEGVSESGAAIPLDDLTTPIDDRFATCEPGGTQDALKICVEAKTPQNASLGTRYIFRGPTGKEIGDVELDVRWEDWSNATDVKTKVDAVGPGGLPLNEGITRHDFDDVFSFRLGGHYSFPIAKDRLIVRAGAAYDTAAAPDSHMRVDFDGKARTTLTSGVAWEASWFRVDLGGGVVLESDVTVVTCKAPAGPDVGDETCSGDESFNSVDDRPSPDPLQPTLGPKNQLESPFNAGTYESGYIMFSLGFTTWF